MTIVRVGTTKKYSEGWGSIFSKGKKQAEPVVAAKKPVKKTAVKKATAKAASKPKTAQPGKKTKKSKKR